MPALVFSSSSSRYFSNPTCLTRLWLSMTKGYTSLWYSVFLHVRYSLHRRQLWSFLLEAHFLFSHGAPPPLRHMGHYAWENHSRPFLNSSKLNDLITSLTQL